MTSYVVGTAVERVAPQELLIDITAVRGCARKVAILASVYLKTNKELTDEGEVLAPSTLNEPIINGKDYS